MSKIFNLRDLIFLLYPLVPLPWLYIFARIHGKFKYLSQRNERASVKNNLLTSFGSIKNEPEINRLTRQFFEYKQMRMLLLTLYPKLKPALKDKLFPIEGQEHLDRALLLNKGVILVGSHLNSIITLIGKDILRSKGYDIRVAIPTEDLPYMPTRFGKLIERFTKVHIGINDGMFYAQFNIRPILRCLAQNAAVILQGDGWHSAGFVAVPFLDRSIPFTTGAMSIARMVETPVVPIFVTGSPPHGLKIVIGEPIALEKSDDPEQDLEMMVGKYVQQLESHLRENIACWEHWLHANALDTMAGLLDKSLSERYDV